MHLRSVGRWVSVGAIGVAAVAVVGLASPSAWAASLTSPTITANPNNLMVNTDTVLTGRHFPPATTLRLAECGRTSWVVTQNPCNTDNMVTVTTSPAGTFRTKFKAELCPEAVRVGPTAVRCYIGVPKPSGVDTVNLKAAVPIVVSYP